jgi:methyl-accepting chemotaxis protein
MQLQSKMFLMTGAIVATTVLSASIAHRYIEEANVLSNMVTENRIPVIMSSRDIRSHFTDTVRLLESYMLFGIDANSSALYRKSRREEFEQAESSLALLHQQTSHFDLGSDAARLIALDSDLAALKTLEEKVETLNESKTPQGSAAAYDTLQNQILPLEKSLFSNITEIAQSQTRLANEEQAQLRGANHFTLIVLWLGTIIASLIGITVSVYLGRKIAYALNIVMQRADAIAAGDLSGQPLALDTTDQTGALAHAVQKMQTVITATISLPASVANTTSEFTAPLVILLIVPASVLRALVFIPIHLITIVSKFQKAYPTRPTLLQSPNSNHTHAK